MEHHVLLLKPQVACAISCSWYLSQILVCHLRSALDAPLIVEQVFVALHMTTALTCRQTCVERNQPA